MAIIKTVLTPENHVKMVQAIAAYLDHDAEKATDSAICKAFQALQDNVLSDVDLLTNDEYKLTRGSIQRGVRCSITMHHRRLLGVTRSRLRGVTRKPRVSSTQAAAAAAAEQVQTMEPLLAAAMALVQSMEQAVAATMHLAKTCDAVIQQSKSSATLGLTPAASTSKPTVAIMGGPMELRQQLIKHYAGTVEFVFINPNSHTATTTRHVTNAHVLCHHQYEGPVAIVAAEKTGLSFRHMKKVGVVSYIDYIDSLLATAALSHGAMSKLVDRFVASRQHPHYGLLPTNLNM